MVPHALTVAGSDSGGGAGIQADLKTFNALSVFGMSVIVALTAQNSYEVSGIFPVPPDFVRLQFETVAMDIKVDGSKTGMLFSSEIIDVVAEEFTEFSVPVIVVDPVMVSKSNARLLKEDAIDALKRKLLTISTLVTPNIPEAEILSGIRIKDVADMHTAAERIHEETGSHVLVKGGHLASSPIDVFYDGRTSQEYPGIRIDTKNTHGTGDTLSSAIVSYMIRGHSEIESIRLAKEYVEGAIKKSFPTGRGYGSLCHWWQYGTA
ncbi:bifunctional hydroxymethylpyrimidine kinase/phosphomethylpyrimidine kinase [Thermoplasma sp.]|uniref:bifunctional hydroxymethylpyrimidine kinase/phosphomethylpyrimidine kinase n=1 Tax=Thermoplasma sp. TaxID=1973142 RepID=UPI0012821DA1|nr:bifunctional hydroxymethylpyrimidine kinase/phosphomethylpyrimidine kinase [Thermoplasma sp.]KAA8922922.1 MAG: bifunctional hydroxymethylpyrimidine kinase/phosphomethylpyrimidine kinase [Thermoplasma sp.]